MHDVIQLMLLLLLCLFLVRLNVHARQTQKTQDFSLDTSFVSVTVCQSAAEADSGLWPRPTYLVELKELLFEPIPLGLLAMSSEPLHPVSAPAWSLQARRYTLDREREKDRNKFKNYI